jgi:uncharacterized membrane protein HdeD (DUF308 family)
MKRLWHLPWLVCSLVGSFIIIQALDLFAGPDGTGMLAVLLLGALAMSHGIACVLGLFLARRVWWRPIPVVLVDMVPTELNSISK